MTAFHAPIAETIWDSKYRLKEADGTPIDLTVDDTWRRIAKALAEPEDEAYRAHYEQEFYSALADFKFLPAGRIVGGAGTGRNVTLFNCFVMGTIPDSMEGIFQNLKEAGLTMQQGGGIGYDFSTLRPKGALVKGVAADASGPLSFMDCWNSMCRTVMSAGSRRGAMMATMRCDHPDILDFIEAKRDAARLRMFNLSVLVTDHFMNAVKLGTKWDLVFGGKVYATVEARDLWDKIMKATYEVAEPGVIFIDRINQMNPLKYCETIAATNPCGEQPLPPYGACLLGSINLAKLVVHPFTEQAFLNKIELAKLVGTAVRMMDNVVDVSRFPLPEQEAEAKAKRRIGLGVTGLADALIMLGITYGSNRAVDWVEDVMHEVARNAYITSAHLAKHKGAFPLFNAEEYLASTYVQRFDDDVQNLIRKYGLRNSHLTSIAPTGTISLYAGNVSSGIEPVFAYHYTRKVLQPDGSRTEEKVEDYAVKVWNDLWGKLPGAGSGPLPKYFVNAQTLEPADHVRMQAAAQKYVDSSISKTINCPEDISFEDFKEVYMMAWDRGCKGCTTYRPNAVTGSILSVESEKPSPAAVQNESVATVEPRARPEVMSGKTYKMKWPGHKHAIYITINDDETGAPFEIFFATKGMEHAAWMAALSRTISAVFRRGGDVRFIADELKDVFDPKGGAYVGGKFIPSMIAQIGAIIEQHIVGQPAEPGTLEHEPTIVATSAPEQCPECGEFAMVQQAGCATCSSCGHSKCG